MSSKIMIYLQVCNKAILGICFLKNNNTSTTRTTYQLLSKQVTSWPRNSTPLLLFRTFFRFVPAVVYKKCTFGLANRDIR